MQFYNSSDGVRRVEMEVATYRRVLHEKCGYRDALEMIARLAPAEAAAAPGIARKALDDGLASMLERKALVEREEYT